MIPNRLVLDTNVCLDLFVFCDPRWSLLAAALRAGTVEAITREDCRTEWLMVLHYPCFALEPARRDLCIARFDRLITLLPAGPTNQRTDNAMQDTRAPLPRCSDTDDQKFLEVARDGRAATLITKDKALLKLASKCRRAGLFTIQKPEAWTLAASPAAPSNQIN